MKLIVHVDGGSRGNPGPAGAGVVIEGPNGRPLHEAGYFLGHATNNVAEYHAFLRALDVARRLGANELSIFADSELLVRQIKGEYRVKNEKLKDLFEAALSGLRAVGKWKIQHVRREGNARADQLANLAMDAGRDVVVIDASRGRSMASGAAKAAAPPTGAVLARCDQAPDASSCPAPCRAGESWRLVDRMPAGLCLHAARAILEHWPIARSSARPIKAACPNDGCGAAFELTRE
jgi:ribonuclease HI